MDAQQPVQPALEALTARGLDLPDPAVQSLAHLGVDEFDVRCGRKYATILVDMTTHRPVDVFADRAANTFAAWLRDHAEVRVICRDRARSYRDGAARVLRRPGRLLTHGACCTTWPRQSNASSADTALTCENLSRSGTARTGSHGESDFWAMR
ncbi:transposase [Streptomyces phaeochromogenes]|uniref:transposase n=1 Tax=Streptomyces phaeochromogenes TaxID=1923 RepID=UPI00389B28E4